MLEEHTIEHGEDDLLLGFREAADALELALELGGRPALPLGGGPCAGHPEQHVGGHTKERGDLGQEHDGKPQAADLVVGEGLLRDAELGGHRLLREAGVLAQLRETAVSIGSKSTTGTDAKSPTSVSI